MPPWRASWPRLGAPRLVPSGRSRCSCRLSQHCGAFPHPGGFCPRIYWAAARGTRRPAEYRAHCACRRPPPRPGRWARSSSYPFGVPRWGCPWRVPPALVLGCLRCGAWRVWTWSLTRPVSRTVRHSTGDSVSAPGLFPVDDDTSPCGSKDATPGSRAWVRVLLPPGRVRRAGLPGAFWCASPFLWPFCPPALLGPLRAWVDPSCWCVCLPSVVFLFRRPCCSLLSPVSGFGRPGPWRCLPPPPLFFFYSAFLLWLAFVFCRNPFPLPTSPSFFWFSLLPAQIGVCFPLPSFCSSPHPSLVFCFPCPQPPLFFSPGFRRFLLWLVFVSCRLCFPLPPPPFFFVCFLSPSLSSTRPPSPVFCFPLPPSGLLCFFFAFGVPAPVSVCFPPPSFSAPPPSLFFPVFVSVCPPLPLPRPPPPFSFLFPSPPLIFFLSCFSALPALVGVCFWPPSVSAPPPSFSFVRPFVCFPSPSLSSDPPLSPCFFFFAPAPSPLFSFSGFRRFLLWLVFFFPAAFLFRSPPPLFFCVLVFVSSRSFCGAVLRSYVLRVVLWCPASLGCVVPRLLVCSVVLCRAVGCSCVLCRVSGCVLPLPCSRCGPLSCCGLRCCVLCCVPGCCAAPCCCALLCPALCCCAICRVVSLFSVLPRVVSCPWALSVALGSCAFRRCLLSCLPALSALCRVCFGVVC